MSKELEHIRIINKIDEICIYNIPMYERLILISHYIQNWRNRKVFKVQDIKKEVENG